MPMTPLRSLADIEEMIHSSDLGLVFFTGSTCKACETVRFKMEELLDDFPHLRSGFINAENHPEVVGPYQIFTVPMFILFVQGKETLREGKFVDFRELPARITRYYDLFFSAAFEEDRND